MKPSRILLLHAIVLLSSVFSAAAQSTIEPEDCQGLKFIQISYREITASVNTTCFGDDESYKIEVTGDLSCTYEFNCETETCEIKYKDDMRCSKPIKPCDSVTYTVTGKNSNFNDTRNTNAAPRFNDEDWQLDMNFTDSNTVSATWGPPAENVFVLCALRANLGITCTGNPPPDIQLDTNTTEQQAVDISIVNCTEGEVTLTVTYLDLSGDVPTDTLESTKGYKPATTTTVPTPTTEKPDELSPGAIAGIVIGCIAGVALIGSVIFCYLKKKLCFEKK